ncbi:30 kDa heat shock protein [Piedraia hortae CBS 480.64]|uniref:30 kDa heat shock protein n=1 Tax=Piedraia hortae CBS 480.64 TaxID=1314780 RepID=A0A6A7C3B5_9PEZI|nr:30 kDa heat shock protein [Piedraia hortae CBS 480.64]
MPQRRTVSFFQNDFVPMFRFLDDYANHLATSPSGRFNPATKGLASIQPKFDIHEAKDSYKLIGELPGMEQKDVQIEFTEPQTINITGRCERSYDTDSADQKQPTVEDEGKETSTEVAKQQPKEDQPKVWLAERSVGQFSRTFSFPSLVDQDHVKASLKNGILSIVVPKAEKANKRIEIE